MTDNPSPDVRAATCPPENVVTYSFQPLAKPGGITLDRAPIDLRKITTPTGSGAVVSP